jgi:penicillin-binding protein 1A
MSKTINVIAVSCLALLLFVTSIGFYLIKYYSKDLPSYEQLKSYSPPITTRLYAGNGELLTEYSREKRIFISIEAIPKNLINAFLAAEDSNFYQHSGIDPLAIIRAVIRNTFSIVGGDGISGGASTITQQVVKNLLLTNEKTFQRKIKEMILALKITSIFSKEKILELYLNQIYLGSSSYGVAAASQVYFDKSIDKLTIEEMALLATLPKAPSKLDPRKNIEKAKIRRDWVIRRMVEEKFISEEEGNEAIEKSIIIIEKNENDSNIKADFFSDSVKKELIALYGAENVFESGILVRTTLKPKLQEYASKALQNGIEKYDMKHGYRGAIGKIDIDDWNQKLQSFIIKKLHKDVWIKAVVLGYKNDIANIGLVDGEMGIIDLENIKWAQKYINANSIGPVIKKISDVLSVGDIVLVEKINFSDNIYSLKQIPNVNGAFLVMDPHNGRVLAMIGGYVNAVNQFNRSTQAQRQSGSVMKTFGYIAALENGLTPATIIMDEPISLYQGDVLPPYQPTNYSNKFYGPTSLRAGLENSINVTTVKMASQIGLDKVSEVISRFGINDNPPQIYSSVLGSIETSLTKLVTAYSIIVNGGKKISPALIEKIQDRDGKTIYKRDKRNCINCFINEENNITNTPNLYDDRQKITDSATAYQITSMLEGVVENGTSIKARSIGKIIGGKTGTTNNSIDSWFVGFSPDLVAGVYVGFDTPETLGLHETGSSIALPIFIDFMKQSLKNSSSTPFRVPDTIKFVKINRDTGALPTPSTPKDKIIFEAFKFDDIIGEDHVITPKNNYNDKSQSNNMGMY